MDNEKLLQAISDMMDKKLDERLQPINDRFDKIDNRLNVLEHKQDRTEKKVDNLRIDVAVAERDIRRDIMELKDEMETVIEESVPSELRLPGIIPYFRGGPGNDIKDHFAPSVYFSSQYLHLYTSFSGSAR